MTGDFAAKYIWACALTFACSVSGETFLFKIISMNLTTSRQKKILQSLIQFFARCSLIHPNLVAPWCSGYYNCTTSFNYAWTQFLRRFKSCLRCVGDSRWQGSLTKVPVGNKAKRLSSVNHTTKAIHHHHHHDHHS